MRSTRVSILLPCVRCYPRSLCRLPPERVGKGDAFARVDPSNMFVVFSIFIFTSLRDSLFGTLIYAIKHLDQYLMDLIFHSCRELVSISPPRDFQLSFLAFVFLQSRRDPEFTILKNRDYEQTLAARAKGVNVSAPPLGHLYPSTLDPDTLVFFFFVSSLSLSPQIHFNISIVSRCPFFSIFRKIWKLAFVSSGITHRMRDQCGPSKAR